MLPAVILSVCFPLTLLLLVCRVQGNILNDIWRSVWPLASNTTCLLDWEAIVATVLLQGSLDRCNLCHLVNEMASKSTCLRSNHSHIPIEQLVTFHCAKA